jgi:gliding motility-associated-like protein
MKSVYAIFATLFFISAYSQIDKQKESTSNKAAYYKKHIKIEDQNGKLITDSIAREAYFLNREKYLTQAHKNNNPSTLNLTPVPLCTNGTFEEFETISGANVLKNFQFAIGDPLNPIQCKSVDDNPNLYITQYNPSNVDLMASTVPSNYLDEYIGNLNAFDQFTLKINYKHTYLSTLGSVQAKRIKTDNETRLKFNYKAVLQSITGNDHQDEQPYFKARVISQNGTIVGEFCLIGNPENCIFTQAPSLEGGSIVLYTPNWQSGIIDISSIPNNEEFTIEFIASRCGLGGHFGYAYVDDICLLHSNENLQGSIELDPLYKICPTLPLSVCGSFTVPNSGGVSASVTSVELKVYNAANTVVYTSTTPISLDIATKRFCFEIQAANLPDITTGTYNVSATINYGLLQTNCNGTSFSSETDDDANPGWDIWFLNCTNCDLPIQTASLTLCDVDHSGTESYNLTNANALLSTTAGLTFSYYETLLDATNDTNAIANVTNYDSSSKTLFVRATLNPTCYKIIAIKLILKNPSAFISGILNVCSGSTDLTATSGASYLWNTGATTQIISATSTGTYSVSVTDALGCIANGSVTILNNQVAVQPTIVVAQPSCFVSLGTITITSVASEFSYDDGVTWGTNATASNLAVGNYIVKIKTASGCFSYGTTIKIVPTQLPFPDFTSVSPISCGGLGSITITTVASAYSFDDGVTWSPNNVLTNLPSGDYLIRTKDASGCISNFNSVTLNSEFLAPPLYLKDNPFCGNLGSITITTPAVSFSFDGGTTWQTSNVLSNLTSGSYIIKIKDAQGCTSPTVYVYLKDLETSYPEYNLVPAGCGTYASLTITTIADSYSFNGGTTWTTNPTRLNLNYGDSFSIVVKKGASCQSYTQYVYVYSRYYPIPLANDYQTTLCDALNDGSENVDLTIYNTNLIANSSNYTFTYYTSQPGAENANFSELISNYTACNLSNSNNTVYVRVTSTDNCHKVVSLQFIFIASPIINMKDEYPLCEFKNVYIDAGSGFNSYHWSNGLSTQIISIVKANTYSVTVTENHTTPTGLLVCNSTKPFKIFLSNPAKITHFETIDWTYHENTITVFVTGLGKYEYSLDGIHYQDSNEFTGLELGLFTVYVRDKNECGIVDGDVALLIYPKFFTPNNDGSNETWRIDLSAYESGLTTKIFDRHGKFIKELFYNGPGWDGTYNGVDLPSNDYWFVVTRANGKVFRGHFTLKR